MDLNHSDKISKTSLYTQLHQSLMDGQGHWCMLDHYLAIICAAWQTDRPTEWLTEYYVCIKKLYKSKAVMNTVKLDRNGGKLNKI